jgi:hypothetical protein
MGGLNADPQRPLSLKFESKPFWSELRESLNVGQTGAALILDICSTCGFQKYRTAITLIPGQPFQ